MVGYDYKGFGRSEGQRALILNEEDFIGDCVTFIENLKQFYSLTMNEPGLKIFAYGYSLGAGLSMGVERLYG